MLNSNNKSDSFYHDGYSMFDSENQIDEAEDNIAQMVSEKILADIILE